MSIPQSPISNHFFHSYCQKGKCHRRVSIFGETEVLECFRLIFSSTLSPNYTVKSRQSNFSVIDLRTPHVKKYLILTWIVKICLSLVCLLTIKIFKIQRTKLKYLSFIFGFNMFIIKALNITRVFFPVNRILNTDIDILTRIFSYDWLIDWLILMTCHVTSVYLMHKY